MIITPGQIVRRANLYFQLASLLTAGVPIIQAIEMVQRTAARRDKMRLGQVVELLNQGATLESALNASGGGWLPAFDLAILGAAEYSGRIDVALRSLGEYYRERAANIREFLSSVAYPAFLLHMALLIFPTGLLTGLFLHGGVQAFIVEKISVLLPLYIGVFFLISILQGTRGAAWRAMIERFTAAVPVLGGARHAMALSRLSAALEALLSAGVPIIQAWSIAANACGSSRLAGTVGQAVPQMEAGVTPAEVLRHFSIFPELFQNLYASGEVSGQLDTTLQRLHHHYEEEASMKFKAIAAWTPRLVFLIVAIIIGYQVISFYTNYFNQLNQFL